MNIIGERVLGLPREPGLRPGHAVEPDPAELRGAPWTHPSTPTSPTSCCRRHARCAGGSTSNAPVEPSVILECIGLAQQAPTATNAQDWRWLVVTDADKKAAIAEVYRGGCLTYLERGAVEEDDGQTRARVPERAAAGEDDPGRPPARDPVHRAPPRRPGARRPPRRRSGRSCPRRGASCSPSGRAVSARCGPPRTSGTRRWRPRSSASPTASPRWRCSRWRTPSAPTSSPPTARRPRPSRRGTSGARRLRCRLVTRPSLLRPALVRRVRAGAVGPPAAPRRRAHCRTTRRGALSGDDRRTTATVLRALDDGRRRRLLPDRRRRRSATSRSPTTCSRSTGPVIDVQTHLVDPARWHGDGADALAGFLRMVDPERWGDAVDPHLLDAAAWATQRVRVERDRDRAAHLDARRRRPQRAARTRRSPPRARWSTATPARAGC